VFDATYGTNMSSTANDAFVSGFPVDFAIRKFPTGSNSIVHTRLTDKELQANTTNAESTDGFSWDSMTGLDYPSVANFSSQFAWMWKRAPSFMDVVAYTGNGTAGRTVSHNLGVAPEMMWVKQRDVSNNWYVYHSGLNVDGDNAPETDYLYLDNTGPAADGLLWYDTAPTATDFTLFHGSAVNGSGSTYIAYLFASLDGVSKVGSYTGNGSTQTINCGFSSGARFVLIKRTDSTGDWYIWDTERGIVAANDPHLSLNTTAAEVTTDDSIDPVSSGFAVNQVSATNINVSSASYIFYAVS
jgi:hypothetical protein